MEKKAKVAKLDLQNLKLKFAFKLTLLRMRFLIALTFERTYIGRPRVILKFIRVQKINVKIRIFLSWILSNLDQIT